MVYHIERGTFEQARKLGLRVEPSRVEGKKISVYKGDDYLGSIGAAGMMDYYKYLKDYGLAVAQEHRRRYKIRHSKDIKEKMSNGYLSWKLLWNG
jgi:hypothetical protein